jgi:hypothetical protein
MIAGLLKAFWKPLVGILIVVALYFAWQSHEATVYQRGYDAAVSERKQQDDERLALKTAQAFAETNALRERMDADSTARLIERKTYETTIDGLRADARRGNSGMRAPGTCVPRNTTPADSTTASGPVDQEGFELLPETAESVLDAASELRNSVQDRNKLIDLYNQMRATCNASP